MNNLIKRLKKNEKKNISTELVEMKENAVQVLVTIYPESQSVNAQTLFGAQPTYDLLIGATGLLRDQLVSERTVREYIQKQQQPTAIDSPSPH